MPPITGYGCVIDGDVLASRQLTIVGMLAVALARPLPVRLTHYCLAMCRRSSASGSVMRSPLRSTMTR